MARGLGLAIVLVLLATPAADAGTGPTGKLISGAEETVLRLHDLPPGYVIEGDSGCEALEPIEELSEHHELQALSRWFSKYRPQRCVFEYQRRFLVPSVGPAPPRVKGEVINTPSEAAAIEGWQVFRRLIRRASYLETRGSTAVGPGGSPALIVRRKGKPSEASPASSLVWRDGKLLAYVEAAGMNPMENDSAAIYYAQVQQQRLESPSPYTEAERDDTEVELDDPNLTLPVYWLGSAFEPANGFGAAELQTADAIEENGLPGTKLELRYDGFNLNTWTGQSWKRFQNSFFRKINHPRCTRTVAFRWGQGHAVISAGYRRRTFDGGCPGYPPTRYWAVAHIGGVVVGVNQTICRCLSPGSGPYSESLRGMKTILRGLALRPKPDYSAEP